MATRLYDIRERGYIAVNGIRARRSHNEVNFVGARECLLKAACPWLDITELMRKRDLVADRIEDVARAVAESCFGMTERELRQCFCQLPNVDLQSAEQFDIFRSAYRASEAAPFNDDYSPGIVT